MLVPTILQVIFQFDKLYTKQGTNEGTYMDLPVHPCFSNEVT